MRTAHVQGRRLLQIAALILLAAGTVAPPSVAVRADDDDHRSDREPQPIVIGHRGAPGYRPEHTLASYELAAAMGADFVEPDLVSTKDGVLVARHENEISATTDVANHPEFSARRTTKTIDDGVLSGWFTEDFTLAELKTLRAKERLPAVRQRNTIYDGRFEVPTFQEVIDLVRRLSRELGRSIGIYPETKHPTYFRSIGLGLEEPLVATLRRNGLAGRRAKVFVQSFETGNLKALKRQIDVPLVQLLGERTQQPFDLVGGADKRTYGDLATPSGLAQVSRYADGVGPSKDYIVPRDTAGTSLAPTTFVDDAHAAGLLVHPYTFRNENQFLPAELRAGSDPNAYGNAIAEAQQFFGLGVDGIFTDNPDTAVLARRRLGG
jgi:glycerophosphoryl diester phosphodiesterase